MEDSEMPALSAKTDYLQCVCIVCKNILMRPVQLPTCLHILCSSCYVKIKDVDPLSCILCPLCKTENILSNSHDQHQPDSEQGGQGVEAETGSNIQCPLCLTNIDCCHTQLLEDMKLPAQDNVEYCAMTTHCNKNGKRLALHYFCLDGHMEQICRHCLKYGDHRACRKSKDLISMASYLNETVDLIKTNVEMLLYDSSREIKERERLSNNRKNHIMAIQEEVMRRKKKILQHLDEVEEQMKLKGEEIVKYGEADLEQLRISHSFLERLLTCLDDIKVDAQTTETNSGDAARYGKTLDIAEKLKICLQKMEGVICRKQNSEMRLILPDVPPNKSIPPLLSCVGIEKHHLSLDFTIDLDEGFSVDSIIVVTKGDECIVSGHHDRASIMRLYKDGSKKEIYIQDHITPARTNLLYRLAMLKSGEFVICRHQQTNKGGLNVDVYNIVYCMSLPEKGIDKCIFGENLPAVPLWGITVSPDNTIIACANLDPGSKKRNGALSYIMDLSLQGKYINDTHNKEGCELRSPEHVTASQWGEIAVSDQSMSSVLIMDKELNKVDRIEYFLPTSMEREQLNAASRERDEETLVEREQLNAASQADLLRNRSSRMENEQLNGASQDRGEGTSMDREQVNADSAEDWTSMNGGRHFRPEGLCYDNHGRIIVTDPYNHSVVRLFRSANGRYNMEPLLVRENREDFSEPRLVTMGPDQRLWVVCKRKIFVFYYS